MAQQTTDASVLRHISKLVEEEEGLYARGSLEEEDRKRLTALGVELDQCWDLLRRRRALREVGGNPDEAQVRSPESVEKYIG